MSINDLYHDKGDRLSVMGVTATQMVEKLNDWINRGFNPADIRVNVFADKGETFVRTITGDGITKILEK